MLNLLTFFRVQVWPALVA